MAINAGTIHDGEETVEELGMGDREMVSRRALPADMSRDRVRMRG